MSKRNKDKSANVVVENKSDSQIVDAGAMRSALLIELFNAPKSSATKKNLRRKLRKLGHRGGLHGVDVSSLMNDAD